MRPKTESKNKNKRSTAEKLPLKSITSIGAFLVFLLLNTIILLSCTRAQSCGDEICQNNPEDCMDLGPGIAICFCSEGYTGETCEILLNDPCENQPCLNSGTCTIESGSDFSCECASGYMGRDCGIDIDECVTNPCLNDGTCVDGVNGFTCECIDGYSVIFYTEHKNNQ